MPPSAASLTLGRFATLLTRCCGCLFDVEPTEVHSLIEEVFAAFEQWVTGLDEPLALQLLLLAAWIAAVPARHCCCSLVYAAPSDAGSAGPGPSRGRVGT